jgi:hypothetical protein
MLITVAPTLGYLALSRGRVTEQSSACVALHTRRRTRHFAASPPTSCQGYLGENTLLCASTRPKMRQDLGKAARWGNRSTGGGRPPVLRPQRGGIG